MKYFGILFGFLILVGFSGIAFAIHDPTYNHPTPFGSLDANQPPFHPDDLKKCLEGQFLQYDWCQRHISKQSPLKQLKAGITIEEIQCKENLVLIQKYNGSPACVKPKTLEKLIDRNWTTSLIVREIALKTMSKNLGPDCSGHSIYDIQNGNIDAKCIQYLNGLVEEHKSEMISQGYSFDPDENVWVRDGYPDVMMTIVDYYLKNSQDSNSNLFNSNCPALINLEYNAKRRIVSCGANPPQAQYSILDVDGIKTCFIGSDLYYYLKAGEKGSITYQYEITENKNDPDEVFDLNQKPHFMCKQGGFVACDPPEISVNYEFDEQYIPVGEPSIITATIEVEKETPSQSFVLHLSPNICANPEIMFGVLGSD